jgi:NTE family protein
MARDDAVAIVLSGGGARAAYQVGLLRCVAAMAPELRFPIITGVSAGAVNAAFLASHPGSLAEATEDLCRLWSRLEVARIFRASPLAFAVNVARWALRLLSGGARLGPEAKSLLDPEPLCELLARELAAVGCADLSPSAAGEPAASSGEITGIARNLESGALRAIALTTIDYETGRTWTWVQGCDIETWERPDRTSAKTRLTVDHVMASAALPLLFPAVRLGDAWHGDGSVRLAAPLAPAVGLGASRIIAVSTRHRGARPHERTVTRYPPPAQVLGKLFHAVFLDVIDHDVRRLETINGLIGDLPPEKRRGMRKIESFVVRPSVDLGRLARQHEPHLPRAFRFMTRGLGTRETESPDFLSLLMFQPDYIAHLIEIGEADARKNHDALARLLVG